MSDCGVAVICLLRLADDPPAHDSFGTLGAEARPHMRIHTSHDGQRFVAAHAIMGSCRYSDSFERDRHAPVQAHVVPAVLMDGRRVSARQLLCPGLPAGHVAGACFPLCSVLPCFNLISS